MKLYVRLEAPYEWVRVSGKNVDAFGEVPTLNDYPLSDEEELIGVVPGEWVTAHHVSLPAKSKRQFLVAAPYALEDEISEDVEKLHFSCPYWKAGEECTVYVVGKQKMRDWQNMANEFKLPLDSLIADHSLLPFHDAADCSIALARGTSSGEQQIIANDKNSGGVCIDQEFVDIWLQSVPMASTIAVNDKQLTEQLIESHTDRDFRYWSFGDKLAHWLEHTPDNIYDLFSDEYRPTVRRRSWRSFAMPIAVLVVSMIVIFTYDSYRYFALHAELSAINGEQLQIIRETFPEIAETAPSNERFMMEQAVARMGGGSKDISVQLMLAETAEVLRRNRVTLGNIVFRDSALVITCQLSDFSQVDILTKQLNAKSRISARLDSSAADDGQIIASYTIAPV